MVRVLRAEELPAGEAGDTEIRSVEVAGHPVLVARLGNGRAVAFGALCPHQLTDLTGATFWDGRLRCPRHNYLYDPHTGENVLPSRDCRPENLWKLAPGYLPVHRVEEADGWVWVAEDPEPAPASYDPELERPRGAGEAPPAPLPPKVDDGPVVHPVKTLKVTMGGTFELRLPTTPRPGYVWRVEPPAEILAVVEERYEATDPPRHRVKLATRNVGEGVVTCTYRRPWDRDPTETREYRVLVVGM